MKRIIHNYTGKSLVYLLLLLPQFSLAAYSNCKESLFKEVMPAEADLIDLESIPKGLLIAREADFISINSNQWYFKHNFIKGKSEVVCASFKKEDLSDSVFFPTLIDLSTERKTGDSFWSFKYIVTAEKIGLWSQKSSLYTSITSFEKFYHSNKSKIKIYKVGFKIYRLVFTLSVGQKYFVDYDLN